MKTLIKLAGMFALTATLILSGCNKDHVSSVKPHKTTDNSKRLHCSPWEDVAANDAVNDLNTVALCNSSTCDGTQTFFHINGTIVRDSGGNIGYYDPLLVTVADQNYIWSYAVSWGIAHTPTGYSLSQITFHTQTTTVPGTSILISTFTFDVVYIHCSGGGGGGES
nr:hypothetical protein [uncultured Fluviicola sp.]